MPAAMSAEIKPPVPPPMTARSYSYPADRFVRDTDRTVSGDGARTPCPPRAVDIWITRAGPGPRQRVATRASVVPGASTRPASADGGEQFVTKLGADPHARLVQ